MNWEKVKIVAEEGTEFGILYDENGELALVVKHPNGKWPHNLKPKSGHNTIAEGNKAYIVVTDYYAKKLMDGMN